MTDGPAIAAPAEGPAPGLDGLPVEPALVAEAAGLDEAAAAARHEELAAAIERANSAYYEDDAPELSDADYDQLFRRLVAIETAYPALITPSWPGSSSGPTGSTTRRTRRNWPTPSTTRSFASWWPWRRRTRS